MKNNKTTVRKYGLIRNRERGVIKIEQTNQRTMPGMCKIQRLRTGTQRELYRFQKEEKRMKMPKLIRDKRTGDYYTKDRRYQIEKGIIGWNVNEWDVRGWYSYSFTAETLKEVRESI